MVAETAKTETTPPSEPAPKQACNPFIQAFLDVKAEQAARGIAGMPKPEEDPWDDVPNYDED